MHWLSASSQRCFSLPVFRCLLLSFSEFSLIFCGEHSPAPSPNGTREVFEFYLSANEILRDDERRWFGFELQETIARGERILQFMNGAPPLVYFTLGALISQSRRLSLGGQPSGLYFGKRNADEKKYLYASQELKNYVRILRKIEREPSEAPQTSAAVRALERARRNRSKTLLEESRNIVTEQERQKREQITAEEQKRRALNEANNVRTVPVSITATVPEEETVIEKVGQQVQEQLVTPEVRTATAYGGSESNGNGNNGAKKQKPKREDFTAQRQPITDLLRDIYDEK
jgi:hypothetical protein